MSKTLVCNCNYTMPLEESFFKKHISGHSKIYDGLCRKEIGQFIQVMDSDEEIIVACTQEKELFHALSTQVEKPLIAPIRFINIREMGGWGKDAKAAQPKIASLLALANLPDPDPLPTVSYDSTQARLLIIGPGSEVFQYAQQLYQDVSVTAMVSDSTPLPLRKNFVVMNGAIEQLTGYLGQWQAQWRASNPIQLDLCTQCGSCIEACPEQAIDLSFQIDMTRCDSNQSCVKACGAIGAIQFHEQFPLMDGEFDFVLDLNKQPYLDIPEPPKGYFAPGSDDRKRALMVQQILNSIGEFEKPRFFAYQEKLCAHGRNGQVGCNACIEICSTKAISSVFEGGKGRVSVNPHLCMGCGGCATACPSGAMTYVNPNVPYLSTKVKTIVDTFAKTTNEKLSPTIILHSGGEGGNAWLEAVGRLARLLPKQYAGIPAHAVPMAVHHIASTGLDLWLGMLTHGVSEIVLMATGEESPQYVEMLKGQIKIASEILVGLGFTARIRLIEMGHLQDIDNATNIQFLDQALQDLAPQPPLTPIASFSYAKEKRQTLEMAIEHLMLHAPLPLEEAQSIPLSKGALIGGIDVNTESCTLCMSCVSACPEGALLDHLEYPQLDLLEKNCVQCGLCSATCPESAITLQPRLSTISQRKTRNTLNEAKPFHCIKCAKPFATDKMMQTMLLKIGSHPAFAGAAQNRLKMCSDCRVIDMMQQQDI